uniref:Uncharacterized protein n=1 Tax=Meloidogyne javanica TaxID=6303 RepID=A0A915LBZ5_MELJA
MLLSFRYTLCNSTVQCYFGLGVGIASGKTVSDCSTKCFNFTASLNHTESNNTFIKALHTGNNKDVVQGCSFGPTAYLCEKALKNACFKGEYEGESGQKNQR